MEVPLDQCVCVCVRACVRACMRALLETLKNTVLMQVHSKLVSLRVLCFRCVRTSGSTGGGTMVLTGWCRASVSGLAGTYKGLRC